MKHSVLSVIRKEVRIWYEWGRRVMANVGDALFMGAGVFCLAAFFVLSLAAFGRWAALLSGGVV